MSSTAGLTGLLLPPAYRPIRLTADRSALAEAAGAAAADIEEGAFFWADRADRLDAALVLAPDRKKREVLPVIYVAGLALADALGAFAPPPTPIAFRWPGGIVIDGALAGTLSLHCAPGTAEAVPAWAVLGFDLTLAAGSEEPGRTPDRTSLAEEGFEGVSPAALIDGFSRHFLSWLDRWEREGPRPIAGEWWRRAVGPGADRQIEFAGGRATALGLDVAGNLRVRTGEGERVLTLAAALCDD
jgi:BirA family biotin operon repressor/biotin-[acetyl-CoA-carboxylase] ligase